MERVGDRVGLPRRRVGREGEQGRGVGRGLEEGREREEAADAAHPPNVVRSVQESQVNKSDFAVTLRTGHTSKWFGFVWGNLRTCQGSGILRKDPNIYLGNFTSKTVIQETMYLIYDPE